MVGVDEIEVVVAHQERATLRVGDVFLKIDTDQERIDAEVEAMAMAPVPTAEVLWRKPPVLALAARPGDGPRPARRAVHRIGGGVGGGGCGRQEAARRAAAALDRPGPDDLAAELDSECRWLIDNDVLPADLVTRNRELAETALRPWTPVFIHGDLQVGHVFVDGRRGHRRARLVRGRPGRRAVRPRHPDPRAPRSTSTT